MSASVAETCGAAAEVPVTAAYLPESEVDKMFTQGAAMSFAELLSEKEATLPV